jgi:uncharacterized protein YceH (UPF0502 family)
MSVQVANRMARKSVVKDLNGNIINLIDETDGGWIIRNRQVVNVEKYNALLQKEKDKQEAAKVVMDTSLHKNDPHAPDRTAAPSKMQELEKKVEGIESKLDQILNALNKK